MKGDPRMITSQLQALVSAGGGLSIDASKYTTNQLQSIVSVSKENSTIILNNCNRFTSSQLQAIASVSKGNVIFNLM